MIWTELATFGFSRYWIQFDIIEARRVAESLLASLIHLRSTSWATHVKAYLHAGQSSAPTDHGDHACSVNSFFCYYDDLLYYTVRERQATGASSLIFFFWARQHQDICSSKLEMRSIRSNTYLNPCFQMGRTTGFSTNLDWARDAGCHVLGGWSWAVRVCRRICARM